MELVGPNSKCQDIEDLYQDVYHLQRLPGRGKCKEANEGHLQREVMDSIKECLWLKWLSTLPEVEQKQLSADTPEPDPSMEIAAINHHTYEEFAAAKWDSYKEMMAMVRMPTNEPWQQPPSLRKRWRE